MSVGLIIWDCKSRYVDMWVYRLKIRMIIRLYISLFIYLPRYLSTYPFYPPYLPTLILPRLRNPLHIIHDERAAQQDGRLAHAVVLVAEGADAAGLHEEGGAVLERLADPAHGEGAEDVAVAYDEDVAVANGGGIVAVIGWSRGGGGGGVHVGGLVLGADLGDESV